MEPVGRRPLEQSQLDEKDVFILDSGNGDVFVWIGRQATPQEKRESMKKADAYLSEHKRPAWTHVERVAQVGNVALFCQLSSNNCFVVYRVLNLRRSRNTFAPGKVTEKHDRGLRGPRASLDFSTLCYVRAAPTFGWPNCTITSRRS